MMIFHRLSLCTAAAVLLGLAATAVLDSDHAIAMGAGILAALLAAGVRKEDAE